MGSRGRSRLLIAALAIAGILAAPRPAATHPMGNFSISHYAGIRVQPDAIRIRYLVDMAEIPTFQEIQEARIVPQADHPTLRGYLARMAESLKEGLVLEVNGRRLPLRGESSQVIFPPGAGGLPTLKLGVVYLASLDDTPSAGVYQLRYRDGNFPDRAGWKEVVALGGPGITLVSSSVPDRDRSRELADYPTDLLESPPQDLDARVAFTREPTPRSVAALRGPEPPPSAPRPRGDRTDLTPPRPVDPQPASRSGATATGESPASAPFPSVSRDPGASAATRPEPLPLRPNSQRTPRNAFTELITTPQLGLGIVLLAMLVAASLGAFHALEPGHGKTVVAAYLVGSRGTAWHAMILGLIVTASHTAGVYLLGAVTLYASRYVLPERLYPWLGVVSGLAITALGFALFLQRYAGGSHPHRHGHPHGPGHDHSRDPHEGAVPHAHGPDSPAHVHGRHPRSHHPSGGSMSLRELVALGITGGIVPCPAALVVLLSALSLRRVGFGLLLIVAFSIGLAAVLIGIGLLMVYARRFMSRFQGEGRLLTRWLPLTSAVVIALSGVAIAIQALVSAGLLQLRL